MAVNTTQLFEQIDGRLVDLPSGSTTLNTKSAKIEREEMSFAEKVLNIISDPTIAYILLMLGFYGILFELYSPGAIFPGIIGVIGLILGFYALHTLPVNYAGLALIVFGIILFLLEIKISSYGMLTIGGIISVLLGSLMLIRTDPNFEFFRISRTVIFTTTAITALFFLFVVGAGLKAQKAKPVTGMEGFIGDIGKTLETLDPVGTVRVQGEIWQAESISGKIDAGESIRVISMKNFKLFVEPLVTSK
jgi:membrane-bound serine protease (ClpP class)